MLKLASTMNEKLKIVVVEDDAIIAKHIENELNAIGHLVVGVAHDSETALDMISNRKPNFLMLDINIEGTKDGIEVAEIVNQKYDMPFMFLTAFSDADTLARARKVRPCGYIVKPFKARDLISNLTIGLYNFENRKKNQSLTIDRLNTLIDEALTQREFDVLAGIMQGFTNAQIAEKNFVSLSTVKFHSQNIFAKLGVKNRSSAISKVVGL